MRAFHRLSAAIAAPLLAVACSTNDHLPEAPRTIHTKTSDRPETAGEVLSDDGFTDITGPVARPHRKIGNPYKVDGVWYYPEVDPTYDSVGTASWYGEDFHNRLTANGEVFDMNQISAAHPTLPLPSTVRVTNIENNRQLVLRVNDRGPFAHDREIDLSKAAAEYLGFKKKGLATVRVEYLEEAKMAEAITKVKGRPRSSARAASRPAPRQYAKASTPDTVVPDQSKPLFEDDLSKPVASAATAAVAHYEPATEQPLNKAMTTVETRLAQTDDGPSHDTFIPQASKLSVEEPEMLAQPGSEPDPFGGLPTGTIIEGSTYGAVPERAASAAPIQLESAAVAVYDPPSRVLPATTDSSGLHIQIGAFSSETNAARAASQFEGAPVYWAGHATNTGKMLYRVRLGPYRSSQAAEDGLKLARAQGFSDARLVTP